MAASGDPVRSDGVSFKKRANVKENFANENLVADQIRTQESIDLICWYDGRITGGAVVVYNGKRYGVISVVDANGNKTAMSVKAVL